MPPFIWFFAGSVAGYAVCHARQRNKDMKKALPATKGVIVLGPSCSTWEIVDVTKASLIVRRTYVDARLAGDTDPYKITNRALQALAPKCRTPNKGMRNIGELDLYASVFDSIMALLLDDDILAAEAHGNMLIQFNAWHAGEAARLGG